MFQNRTNLTCSIIAAAVALTIQPAAAQRHERKQAEIEQSAKATAVSGGVTFQSTLPYDRCFDAVASYLKRTGHEIEFASKETGTIVTSLEIAGKHSQTGTRIHVTLMKDSESQTSVRVGVSTQKRKKLLQTEPWSDPKLDDSESQKTAGDLEDALKAL